MSNDRFPPAFVALALCLLCSTGSTLASTPTVGELGTLQADTIILKARAARAVAQRELEESGGREAAVLPSNTQPPVVSKIYGNDQQMMATFLFEGGFSTNSRVGAVLPGGYRVIEITSERVQLERNGRRIDVPFSNFVPSRPPERPASPSSVIAPMPAPLYPNPDY